MNYYVIPSCLLVLSLVLIGCDGKNIPKPDYRPQEGDIQWNYDECRESFMAFYTDYGNYHYEGAIDEISIDYAITPEMAEEDAAQYCDYFFDRI